MDAIKKLLKRLFCAHGPWQVTGIAWDGEARLECRQCGKIKRQGL